MHRLPLAVILFVSASVPALADSGQDCYQHKDPQVRIKGCSDIIQRNPNDATAYHNRAVAYGLAGDIDKAIADYTKTIEIKPDNATAYDNRGRAYASKGDYTRALDDELKASELISKAAARPATVAPKRADTAAAVAKGPKPGAAVPVPPKTVAVTPIPAALAKEIPDDARPAWRSLIDKSLN